MTGPGRRGPRARALHAPAVTDEQRRSAVVALIGRGLDLQPGDPWGVARDLADALGLPVRRPARTHRQSPLTGRIRPFERRGRAPEGEVTS